MQQIFFIISRSNDFKWYASIIDFFIKKGLTVKLLYHKENLNNEKFYLKPENANINFLSKIEKIFFNNQNELKEFIIKNYEIFDYIFSIRFISGQQMFFDNFNEKISKKWCVINRGLDSFSQFDDKDIYFGETIFFSVSDYINSLGRDYIKKYHNTCLKDFDRMKKFNVGHGIFNDQLTKKVGNNKIRNLIYIPFSYSRLRFGKNSNFAFQAAYSGLNINFFWFYKSFLKKSLIKSILYFLKEKLLCLFEIIKRYTEIKKNIFSENEKEVINSIKEFCKNNDLKFITKPRLKFPFNHNLKLKCDEIIFDSEEKYLPTLFQQQLKNSCLVVGSMSHASIEAIMCNIPYINIKLPDQIYMTNFSRYFHIPKENSWYNYDGVIYEKSIKEMINSFSRKKINDFKLNKIKQKNFLSSICGIEDIDNHSIPKKIFDILNAK